MQLLLILTFVYLSVAQNFFITDPIQSTAWKAGSTVRIKWDPVKEPQLGTVDRIDLDLVDGDANDARQVAKIASGIRGNATSIDYQVPADLSNKGDYFIRMTAIGPNGETSNNYSGRFRVTGGKDAPSITKAPVASNTASMPKDTGKSIVSDMASSATKNVMAVGISGLFTFLMLH